MFMFSPKDKMTAVERYLLGTESQREVAASIGVCHSHLRSWIRHYQYHGPAAFENTCTSYAVETKLEILAYMHEHGLSVRKTAAIFNIPAHATLQRWLKIVERDGPDGLRPTKKGDPVMKKNTSNQETNPSSKDPSVKALQAEIEYLRMENAYLKKLNALVQNKEKSQKRTK